MDNFETRARTYHEELSGLVRATLVDHGISSEVVSQRLLGWDNSAITVPIRGRTGKIAFFERWAGDAIGTPNDTIANVELYGWDVLERKPARVVIAEGIHEALVLQSNGIPAVSASGSGRFFKSREWGDFLREIPQVVLAYRRGEKRERRKYLLSRDEVRARANLAIPEAVSLTWPKELGTNGGAYAFFVTLGKTAEDFERLLQPS